MNWSAGFRPIRKGNRIFQFFVLSISFKSLSSLFYFFTLHHFFGFRLFSFFFILYLWIFSRTFFFNFIFSGDSIFIVILILFTISGVSSFFDSFISGLDCSFSFSFFTCGSSSGLSFLTSSLADYHLHCHPYPFFNIWCILFF